MIQNLFYIMTGITPEMTGPRFGSILFLTLSWNECLVWRTIHKYERFFSDKYGFENCSLECPVFELPRQ
jgi:hypothetical protein